jgi:hypothetical protein
MDQELYKNLVARTESECVRLLVMATTTIQREYGLTDAQRSGVAQLLTEVVCEVVKTSLDLCIELCQEEARR